MEDERKLAVELFNGAWTLLRKEDRTPGEDAELVHTAHASVYHWSRVGTHENLARGEWQVSRVYAVLGRDEPALWHARRCLALCERHGMTDWDLGFAHEAMARAYAVAGQLDLARQHAAAARAVPVKEDEDRELLLADLATLPV